MADFGLLKKILTDQQVLECGTPEYEKAVFIGNLNYRWTTPAVVVQAKSVEDVRATINFARQNQVRLTVKNGGHSYMGYCLNKSGIVLDISPMRGCYIDYDKMLVEMQGGLVWKDVYYKYLKDKRNIVIGGQCPTVGVSGFTLGAGLSPFSRSYGLGCDNLLEMTVVTYDGNVVKLSPDDKDEHKRDLFWAMNGGGGGNFGVAVSLTSRMHKLRDQEGRVVCGQLLWNLPQQKEAFEKMMNTFNTNKCPDELTIDALWSHGKDKQLTGGMTVIYNGAMDKAEDALKELLAFEPVDNTLKEMEWTDWVHQAEGWDPMSTVYHHHASFIFAEGAITPEVTAKISDLVDQATKVVGITNENATNDPKCHILWDHIGGKTERVAPEDTAFFWRKGHYVSTIKMQWVDPHKKKEIMEFICKCKAVLLPYAIDQKAAYINYIDITVPNWQEAYYGLNYPRLQKVKTRWDPENFFWNWQSIKPLEGGKTPMPVHDVLAVPSKKEFMQLPQVQKVQDWWNEYALDGTPDRLGEPKTNEAVFKVDGEIRREILETQTN
ncbi:hypothetical protein FZEAL_8557 [Fusarium zealandicum]|uniref:FAD-binding PCMH-type domain-containing protein n=1 Tax=Fusarium zealandicum TaxID=1053134 RepID=A0A8H4UE39_9HYPO|nr:hypothetical protein FZEAL_8557 [Fusarium zealandicum]